MRGPAMKKLFERIRDHTRDDLCIGLQELGIDARLVERSRKEEKSGLRIIWRFVSLGLIKVKGSPIQWINIRKHSTEHGTSYIIHFGIPDRNNLRFLAVRRFSSMPRISLKRIKSFPVLGRVIDAAWQGDSHLETAVESLTSDLSLKKQTMDNLTLSIKADVNLQCWVIETHGKDVPSKEQWRFYETIARHLLNSPNSELNKA